MERHIAALSAAELTTSLKRVNSNVTSQSSSAKGFAAAATTRVRFAGSLNGSYATLFNSFTFNIKGDYFYSFVGQGAQCENGKTTVAINNPLDGQLGCFRYKTPDASKTPDDVAQSEAVTEHNGTFSMANKTLLQRLSIFTPENLLAKAADVSLTGNEIDLTGKVITDANAGDLATEIAKLSQLNSLRYVRIGHVGSQVTYSPKALLRQKAWGLMR